MFYYLNVLINLFYFDRNEKLFFNSINFKNKKLSSNKEKIFLEVIPDYYHLSYYCCIFEERLQNCELIAYWPDVMKSETKKSSRYLNFFFKFRSNLFHYFLKRKWQKLYSRLGVRKFYSFSEILSILSEEEKNKIKNNSINIFKKLKTKNNVLNIKLRNILLGDLIYDTYLRSTSNFTLNINDPILLKIIKNSEILITGIKKLILQENIKTLYLPYGSYIAHGAVARLGVSLNKTVYTSGNYQYNKKLSKNDLRHCENIHKFRNIFNNLKNKNKRIKKSKNLVKDFFFSKSHRNIKELYPYMDYSSFRRKHKYDKNRKKYDIAIFLPNFFETQREWGKIIFNDFYEWIIFTLDFFKRRNINIAIKPHPNSYTIHKENIELIKKLKKKYKQFNWLNSNTANRDIFNQIKLAISPWGSVLWELAYFKIPSISIGDNPGKQYNLSYIPKNKKEYFDLLKNYKKLKCNVSRLKIYEFIYIYMLNNNDAYPTLARKIQLKKIDLTHSYGLKIFIEKFKKIRKKNI